jgi:hypothetical protein
MGAGCARLWPELVAAFDVADACRGGAPRRIGNNPLSLWITLWASCDGLPLRHGKSSTSTDCCIFEHGKTLEKQELVCS